MTSKTFFIKDIKGKEDVQSLFLVKHLAVMESRDGRHYLNVILADKTGDLEAKKWHGAQEVVGQIQRGDLVSVTGKTNVYQGRLQLIISEIALYAGPELEMHLFVPASASAPEAMFEQLMKIVQELDDVYIRDLLQLVLFTPEIQRRLKSWPAGKTIHHAYQGGLLEHILSCSNLGLLLATHYRLNRNYVIAGTILHDLGKIYELSDGHLVEYTEEGKLVGHLVKGVEIMDRFAAKIKNFPFLLKLHLKHILISHHGELEYGSPKVPATSEAYLVHLIDLMDSKIGAIAAIKKTDTTPGNWSAPIKHLERAIFKGELPTFSQYLPEVSEEREVVARESSAEKRFKSPSLGDLMKNIKLGSPKSSDDE